MEDPREGRELLALFKVGLASGLIKREEATAWADGIILREPEPDILFIELSLAKTTDEAVTLLGECLRSEAPVNGMVLLGLLHRSLMEGEDLGVIVRTMYGVMDVAEFTELERGYIYQLNDGYDLASEKIWGTIPKVRQDMEEFLSVYSDFTWQNHGLWETLGKKADQALKELEREYRAVAARATGNGDPTQG
ncbi:hypothetical protein GCM10011405_30450 [Rufibacter glacialis]|nr:hypothetical protein GCM10011405_30450 [Rufibacter glacialis]